MTATAPLLSITPGAPAVDERALRTTVAGILQRHPAVGLACAVVADGRLALFDGHGLADLASHAPVTPDTVFRIGSLTKTMTAIAVLQLVERGLIDLDARANDHLRAYRLVPAKPEHRPATVRHLLTYTAGLPECVYLSRAVKPVLGEMVPFGQRVPSLAEYYRGELHLIAEPGAIHIYSNHAFATLGQIVEDVTGEPLDRWFREHIFAPLGMEHTDLVRSERVRARLATGYALRARGPRAVEDCDLITVGGGGVYSTSSDLALYLKALLGGGANEHGSILRRETLAAAFAAQYQPDPRVPGVGFAFYRRALGDRLIVEKDGLLPGFGAQISLAPSAGVGVILLTNGTRAAHAWMGDEAAALLGQILGVALDAPRSDVPHHAEIWSDLCGWYSLRGSFRDVQRWFVAGVQVFVGGDGLMMRALSPIPALWRGVPLRPDDTDDPRVFRIDLSAFGVGTSRVVFSGGGEDGAATSLHFDPLPLSFDRGRT